MTKKTTQKPVVKILVCYHKPSELFKNDILVPIHVGRSVATHASKDGVISADDYKWMLDNMIGDDSGDNISLLNRNLAELTAIYWAWKNYDKLGNPDYIGLSHYRRLFKDEDIKSVPQYDITATPVDVYKSIKEQFAGSHDVDYLNKAVDILTKIKPEYKKSAEQYLNQNIGYWFNMFIMKKELFFEYCDLVFNVLFKLHKKINYSELNSYNQRMPAFIAERLLGIFITHKKRTCSVNDVDVIFIVDKKVSKIYKFKYILHKCLSCITFGKTREHQKKCANNYKKMF